MSITWIISSCYWHGLTLVLRSKEQGKAYLAECGRWLASGALDLACWFTGGAHDGCCCSWKSCGGEKKVVAAGHGWCWSSRYYFEWLDQKGNMLLLLVVSYWPKVMPFTVVLPRLMAVLPWKEMKMVFRLVFLLV